MKRVKKCLNSIEKPINAIGFITPTRMGGKREPPKYNFVGKGRMKRKEIYRDRKRVGVGRKFS